MNKRSGGANTGKFGSLTILTLLFMASHARASWKDWPIVRRWFQGPECPKAIAEAARPVSQEDLIVLLARQNRRVIQDPLGDQTLYPEIGIDPQWEGYLGGVVHRKRPQTHYAVFGVTGEGQYIKPEGGTELRAGLPISIAILNLFRFEQFTVVSKAPGIFPIFCASRPMVGHTLFLLSPELPQHVVDAIVATEQGRPFSPRPVFLRRRLWLNERRDLLMMVDVAAKYRAHLKALRPIGDEVGRTRLRKQCSELQKFSAVEVPPGAESQILAQSPSIKVPGHAILHPWEPSDLSLAGSFAVWRDETETLQFVEVALHPDSSTVEMRLMTPLLESPAFRIEYPYPDAGPQVVPEAPYPKFEKRHFTAEEFRLQTPRLWVPFREPIRRNATP